MRNRVFRIGCLVTLVWIAASTGLHAQSASATAPAVQTASGEAPAVQLTSQTPAVLTPVPRVIWFNGAFRPTNKLPVARVETVTVAVYREREGGDAVWQETQIVTMEADGRYSLLMGSTSSDGMPLEVFTSGEPRWIGITVNRPGETEQPRVHSGQRAVCAQSGGHRDARRETGVGVPAGRRAENASTPRRPRLTRRRR